MYSSGVCSLPFFALAINRASLNSGLLMEHMCCHMFLPAHVFLSSLGNIPVTEIGGSPFPNRGAILDVGGCSCSGVVCDPTTCDDAGISSSGGTDILVSSGKKLPYCMEGGNASLFFLCWLDLLEVVSDSESEKLNGLPQSISVHLSCFCRTVSSFWKLMSLASSSAIFVLACANFCISVMISLCGGLFLH